MDWIVYQVGPIDHGWNNLRTVQDTVADIAGTDDEFMRRHDLNTDGLTTFIQGWESAKDAAAREGWEGDFLHAPRVFWLPSEIGFDYGFVFKQENNGTTFIMSPQDLPAVARLAY